MDKIYSRKRIKIPKLEITKTDKKKNSKKLRLLIIIIIAILTFYIFLKLFEPIYDGTCNQKVINIATNIINTESKNVLDKYEYSKLVTTIKDSSGTNTVVTNVALINRIAFEITYEIENKLARINDEKIEISLGAFTGNKYLSSLGPKLKLNISPIGNLHTELKTEFKEQGINQTLYRVYLDLECPIKILSAYKGVEQNISNKILLVETVIVGEVPQTYYNLDDVSKDETLNLLN